MEKTRQVSAGHESVRMLVLTALFTALGYVATRLLIVPSPTGGYMNLGDAVVLLGAYLLGPVYGAIAGGLGPALADLLSGYPAWVPGTLVIKALMGLTAALLYRALGKKLCITQKNAYRPNGRKWWKPFHRVSMSFPSLNARVVTCWMRRQTVLRA